MIVNKLPIKKTDVKIPEILESYINVDE